MRLLDYFVKKKERLFNFSRGDVSSQEKSTAESTENVEHLFLKPEDNKKSQKEDFAAAEEQARWKIGDRIKNRYEIHDIKRGGFGIVYICYDHESKNSFAIKTFQAKYLHSQKARENFKEEALRWTKLDKHRNIVKAHIVDIIEGQPHIFLEYVAGGNLDEWLYTKMLDLPLTLNFAIQFCNGMEYAYNKMELIHLDIKPGNILLTKDRTIKITDFGLSKTREITEHIAALKDSSYVQSKPAGTLSYVAPEQLTGKEIDTRTDIYAFGIVLYQMLTKGDYPYSLSSDKWHEISYDEWLMVHLKAHPKPIRQNIPHELKEIVYTCLEKEPIKRRYQNFSDLKQELSKLYFDLTGERITEEPITELEVWELSNKGAALSNLGRYKEAVACCEKALEINPGFAWAWYSKGYVLNDLGRYQEAIECYDKALEINPRFAEFAETWNNKGVVLGNLSKYQEAAASYHKAIEINPIYAEAWYNKGVVLGYLGRYQEAIECYDKALEINPKFAKFAEAWYNKGVALNNMSRYQEAIACYDKALEINPGFAEAWSNKGVALNNMSRYQEAVACYDKALEINPGFAEAWSNKGGALDNLGRHQEAVKCCDKALKINPGFAEALYNKGAALNNMSMYQEAIASFYKFIEKAPPQYASNIEAIKKTIRQLEEKCH